MRVGTWNYETGLTPRRDAIASLDADVLALQEVGKDFKAFAEEHEGWTCEWQVGRVKKGVAVLTRHPFSISRIEFSRPCALSTLISGPNALVFRFVGFWAMSPSDADDGYAQQANELLSVIPSDGLPTVIAGDFNARSRNADHRANVKRLVERGLVSAYHRFYGIEQTDPWRDPTSFHRWNLGSPHHMDYVFLPDDWSVTDVSVGTFDDYVPTHLSDHMPVVVTV
jgi:endonuclease/exonuclease/phosphatase family metal-dependent hydrolase